MSITNNKFTISSDHVPSGDQPKAIETILNALESGIKSQVMLGVTGSGKTFTMANIIKETNRAALIVVYNKTLAAQIYLEMKALFPNNAVEYFVSYYNYYQPEAYIAKTDTYIEKESDINEQIDLMRHSATRALFERKDVIIVSSVSCIYGLGSPTSYSEMIINLKCGEKYNKEELLLQLTNLQYQRNDIAFERGNFRVVGDNVDIFPSHYEKLCWRLSFFGKELEEIYEMDSLTRKKVRELNNVTIYANSHFITPRRIINQAIKEIKQELNEQVGILENQGKLLEASRLLQRTNYDIEMLETTNHCRGIENYSRFLTGRNKGEPPPTLFEYLPEDALLFVDESHATIPQIQAMYNGDRSRKSSLVEHGFRLPSALDNRPLKFEEWMNLRPQTIFVSATPGEFELTESKGKIVELIIRPTGLIDPECIVKPAINQIDDLINEINFVLEKKLRILVITLTKKMAEDLSSYLQELNYKVQYLHSSISTLERVEIIKNLREGTIDIIVGINLLREGLDIPECGLVAILDADKEGFLRSKTSLIQTIGRAARNKDSKVLIYADILTGSIKSALFETNRRRNIQKEYNEKFNITPKTINSKIHDSLWKKDESDKKKSKNLNIVFSNIDKVNDHIQNLKKKMRDAASNLDFEKAASIRDEILLLEKQYLYYD